MVNTARNLEKRVCSSTAKQYFLPIPVASYLACGGRVGLNRYRFASYGEQYGCVVLAETGGTAIVPK